MAKKPIAVDEDLYELSVQFHQKKLNEIPELLKMVGDKNLKDVEKRVHKIKGISASYGLDNLAILAGKMEKLAQDNNWSEAKNVVLEMDAWLKDVEIVHE